MSSLPSRAEMLLKLKEKMKEKGKGRDPDQFAPPSAKDDETLEFYLRILPPLMKGDKYKGGVAEKTEDLWFYENGAHYIKQPKAKLTCPRCQYGDSCPICQIGFDMMEGEPNKDVRSSISSKYLARSYYSINVYFLNSDKNPESIRGRVMWFNIPKTLFDIMDYCINNEKPGDEDDPQACGIFYHPDEGYTFKLVVKKKGEYNTYETSKFLATTMGPLFKTKEGSPDKERIKKILEERVYLPDKFEKVNIDKINEMASTILDGDKKGDGEKKETKKEESKNVKVNGVEKGGANKIKSSKKDVVEEDVVEEPVEQEEPVAEEPVAEEPEEKPATKQTTKPATAKTTKTETKTEKKPEPATEDDTAELESILGDLEG